MDGQMDEWIDECVCSSQMNGFEVWVKGRMDERTYHRWANRYNTLVCSEAIGPKWAIVVGSKLEIKNNDDKISTVSTYCLQKAQIIYLYVTACSVAVRKGNMA